ncbi:MAG: hypothetical protein ABIJ45_07240 [Candidatus Zixiibacteriota bacterium]
MIIKSFTAPTIAGALKLVRETLGGDAIVLKTKDCGRLSKIINGNRFEVTACIDESFLKKPIGEITGTKSDSDVMVKPLNNEEHTFKNDASDEINKPKYDRAIEKIRTVLTDSDVPRSMIHQIVMEILSDKNTTVCESKAFEIIKNKLAGKIEPNLTVVPGSKIAFIGLSGAGKSSVMGKVSANLSMIPGNKLKLISLDQLKDDEIGKTKLLTNNDFTKQFDSLPTLTKDKAILIIDTPAIPAKSDNQWLLDKLNKIKPELIFLVYSVSHRSDDLMNILETFKSLAPTYQIATHLDETDRWGGILTMVENLDIPLAFVTDSPGGEGQLYAPDPEIIANQILNRETKNDF